MPTMRIVVTKEATFRGQLERWSNGYNFQIASAPIDAQTCEDVSDAVWTMEQAFHVPAVKFVYFLGGALGQDAVYSFEYHDGGRPGTASGSLPQLELCTFASAKIAPKKFLSKYYHGAAPSSDAGDAVASGPKAAMETLLLKLTDGTLPHSATACRPDGSLVTAPFKVDKYVRTHQLKRRGKRP